MLFRIKPRDRGRLSKETIIARIAEAKASFPSLKVVVFSGGEAMMLKGDLFAAVAYCSAEGLRTRIVSNGYWGKTTRSARAAVNRLKDAGLSELNISTGVDHRQWVPLDSVVNAAACAAEAGMFCLVTVESESSDERVVDQLMDNPRFARQVRQGAVSFQSNSWMPFNTGAEDRKQEVDLHELRRGCAQVLDTVVVTPHDNLSACCGLALEHIPELRLGRNDGQNMEALYTAQLDDFLKLWLRVEGPYSIIERVMEGRAKDLLERTVHVCEACLTLHKNPEVRRALSLKYQEFVPEVVTRFKVGTALRKRLMPTKRRDGDGKEEDASELHQGELGGRCTCRWPSRLSTTMPARHRGCQMQPPIDVSLHALNPKTLLSLLGMGVLPLLVVLAAILVMSGGRPPKGVALTVLLVAGLVAVVGIWQLASVRLRVDDESLTVGGGFYKLSVPLDRLTADSVEVARGQTYLLGARTNGIGMPGLSLGWFDLRGSGKAFAAITEPAKVVRINTREGYTVLVSADEPEALAERLRRH